MWENGEIWSFWDEEHFINIVIITLLWEMWFGQTDAAKKQLASCSAVVIPSFI